MSDGPSKKKKLIRSLLKILLILFVAVTIIQNVSVGRTYYHLHYDELPEAFDHYKIAQVSDLHDAEYGRNNAQILKALRDEAPDIIVITGDLSDEYHPGSEAALKFAEEAAAIAPSYYVTGNHEARMGADYIPFMRALRKRGIHILHNENVRLEKGKDSIILAGIDDPEFSGSERKLHAAVTKSALQKVHLSEGFTLLLAHRPEFLDLYAEAGADLVLAGHTHGGQRRVPFIGALVAPGQGFLPEYDAGLYEKNGTRMVLSRGLGNSFVPFRINSRPEIVFVELLKNN